MLLAPHIHTTQQGSQIHFLAPRSWGGCCDNGLCPPIGGRPLRCVRLRVFPLGFLLPTLYPACGCAQSCPTLCDPVDCSPPGSSVHGILQARILDWVAMPSSRGDLPDPEIKPTSLTSPELADGFFTTNTMWEAPRM